MPDAAVADAVDSDHIARHGERPEPARRGAGAQFARGRVRPLVLVAALGPVVALVAVLGVGGAALAQSPGAAAQARVAAVAQAGPGASYQAPYQDSVRNDPATYAYARWLTDLGGQVCTAPLLPPRLLIYDRDTALVPIDPADTTVGALCTREPGILASLTALFDQAWDAAIPLGADRVGDE